MIRTTGHLRTALWLAELGLPALPLHRGKRPFANCPECHDSKCGDRPNMKMPGPCMCLAPCHGWAAATTDPTILTSKAWARTWQVAGSVAYHPGGAGLTVVDLDNADAIAWARQSLPPTKAVVSTRGEHWIYRGAMRSANRVLPGVDIKSSMAYARWLGPGTDHMTGLPDVVRALVARKDATRPRGEVASSVPGGAEWNRSVATGCRHTGRFVRTGLERGLSKIRQCQDSGAGSQTFGVARFLAAQHAACPGPCELNLLGEAISAAAVSVGVPEPYAQRAVARGFAAAGAIS
ncbi:bifunctional DNA primase/polymerase [Streptomyces sp. NBC_00047]|uniref:bifunctional DNA primase/polymerase n=1 Tax=Streptomyces sp. NBC_00047 TaxID=2975627 RepID=UPI0022580A61|nr:bifunctional DNA primase/polymerase [Streptomyces sp. NBC_00047]MCX5608246.1 bifunctional DNA primase/polymerase [Streptomyces sp. NBC_00047]